MMANTTISEIINEIKGAEDAVVASDKQKDYIRRISVTNTKVAFVKKSNELVNSGLYASALLVVAKNLTTGAGANQYSVTRFW